MISKSRFRTLIKQCSLRQTSQLHSLPTDVFWAHLECLCTQHLPTPVELAEVGENINGVKGNMILIFTGHLDKDIHGSWVLFPISLTKTTTSILTLKSTKKGKQKVSST